MQEVKDEMKRQGREDEFIGSRVLHHSHPVCTLHPLTIVSPEDHLYHDQSSHTRGAQLVHGGLSGSQEGVPGFGRRSVLSTGAS